MGHSVESAVEETTKTSSKGGASGARHTIVFAQGLFDLASAWADAEGRTVGSVLTYALETGLRTALQQGVIPDAAVAKYRLFCNHRRSNAEDERELKALREQRIINRRPQNLDEYIEMRERQDCMLSSSSESSEPTLTPLSVLAKGLGDSEGQMFYRHIRNEKHLEYAKEWEEALNRQGKSLIVDHEDREKVKRDIAEGLIP